MAFRLRGNENSRSDDNGEGQPPLEQPNSPKQVCPTDPPIPCSRSNCPGSPNPPDAYRCKSRSTTIEGSIEITLFACQCCPDQCLYCDDERCDGEEKGQCKSEHLKGRYCIPRNPSLYSRTIPMYEPARGNRNAAYSSQCSAGDRTPVVPPGIVQPVF